MDGHDDHNCGSIGMWMGLLCAALGVGAAWLMVKFMNLSWLIGFPPEVLVGVIVLFIAAAALGTKAGRHLCGKREQVATHVLAGLGVAFGSIAIAVMTGTILGVLMGAQILNSYVNPFKSIFGIFGPLLLVLIFGGLPAIFLGVLYGLLVMVRLRN